jgi:DNA-binding NarL/FixJ family response regulator
METVKSHVAQVLHKLDARSRLQAAIRGIRLGLVEWPEDR